MAEHLWTVLCGKMLVDSDTGVISLVDVIENLTVEGLEQKIKEGIDQGKKGAFVNEPMKLVSWWFRTDVREEVLQARVIFLNPAGEALMEQSFGMPWEKEQPSASIRAIVNLDRFPANMLGLYWFSIEQLETSETGEARWLPAARVPLSVDST